MASSASGSTTAPTQNDLAGDLQEIESRLDSLTEGEAQVLSDEELVRLRDAVKSLEDTVESTRKETVDEVVKDRVNPGDSLLGLSHIKSHNKFVTEDAGKIIMRAVTEGIDYTEFISVKASKLDSIAPGIAEIKKSEYTYLR